MNKRCRQSRDRAAVARFEWNNKKCETRQNQFRKRNKKAPSVVSSVSAF